jgi:hypothetical protein
MNTVTGAPIAPPYLKDLKEKRAAAIEPRRPLIHDVDDALENLGCQIERLAALYESNTIDFNELVLDTAKLPSELQDRVYSIWMIYVLAGEKLDDVLQTVSAITDKLYENKREAGRA